MTVDTIYEYLKNRNVQKKAFKLSSVNYCALQLWTINGHRSQPQFRRLVHVVSGIHRLQLLQNCH